MQHKLHLFSQLDCILGRINHAALNVAISLIDALSRADFIINVSAFLIAGCIFFTIY